ncbi:UNVERIFIED_CONTAM: hypothetical protein Scaly_0888100 [Sesamum calycinum]|uniref:Retrotransposon gag domain-containing protein n=1 Tax=Sesamum calycinum TaxID=2727403 RepID=A0AAW2QVK3_9LAMI
MDIVVHGYPGNSPEYVALPKIAEDLAARRRCAPCSNRGWTSVTFEESGFMGGCKWKRSEPPEAEDANGMLRKWKIKAGKALFVLKPTIEEDVLEHIHETNTPKEAWDTFAKLFSKKNDTKLQLIESELLSVAQRNLTVAQYFHKVKSLCREISKLDPEAPIGEARMK